MTRPFFSFLVLMVAGTPALAQTPRASAPAPLVARLGVALPVLDLAQESSLELREAIQRRLVGMLTTPEILPVPLHSTEEAGLRREALDHRLQVVLVATLSNHLPDPRSTAASAFDRRVSARTAPPTAEGGVDVPSVSVEFRLVAVPILAPRLWFARPTDAIRADDDAIDPVLKGMVKTLEEVLLGPR